MIENDFILAPRFKLPDHIPLQEYFGLWCIHDATFDAIVSHVNGMDLEAHIVSAAARDAVAKQAAGEFQKTDDGVGVFRVSGPMMKTVSSLSGGTSTVRVRQQLRAAAKDPEIIAGMLIMDTPGGTVRGNSDLAEEVQRFAGEKPIIAFTEDMTASAGVSVASQATKRYANSKQALYGSMGTYSVLQDHSGVANKVGVKIHVVRAGAYKGMGEPGTEITKDQLAEAQRVVNSLNEGYLQLIATGLKKDIEQIRTLADGRIHTAVDAQAMGLIDGIRTYEAAYQELLSLAKKPTSKLFTPPRSNSTMSAATLTELKQAFPKSNAEWRESQLIAQATMQDAAIAYGQHVEAAAAAAELKHKQELAAAKDDADKAAKDKEAKDKAAKDKEAKDKAAKAGTLGHRALKQTEGDTEYSSETGDALEDFNAAVAKIAGPAPSLQKRHSAIRIVAKKDPELYQAFLLASNPGSRQQRMIKEKMESTVRT